MSRRSEPGADATIRPTPAGWAVAGMGIVTTLAGLGLGLPEITGLGLALVLVVGFAAVVVVASRANLICERTADAPRAMVGEILTVTVSVAQGGSRRTPRVRLHDTISYPDGQVSIARRMVGPLDVGEGSTTQYSLRSSRRGICEIGPMVMSMSDPFGLIRRSFSGPGRLRVTILPTIAAVVAPQVQVAADTPSSASPVSAAGPEFAALRSYSPGDDLRKVHWRSSARRDELMIRRDEQPQQDECTVLLDVRSEFHDEESFERAISAAASILVAASRAGQATRLCTSAGFDSRRVPGRSSVEIALGTLAVLATSSTPMQWAASGASAVTVLATTTGYVSLRMGLAGRSPAHVVVFRVRGEPGGPLEATARTSVLSVELDEDFADRWNRAATSDSVTHPRMVRSVVHERVQARGR